jgi:hypothetical protein
MIDATIRGVSKTGREDGEPVWAALTTNTD